MCLHHFVMYLFNLQMVGLGTNKFNMNDSQFKFTSLLGSNAESYGMSYHGAVSHDSKVMCDGIGFRKGNIIGMRLDMWQGTLQFYLDRKPQGEKV